MCNYVPSRVGFRQESTTAREIFITNADPARSSDNLDRWPSIPYRCCQSKTIHGTWHLNIRKHYVDFQATLKDVNSFVSVARLHDLVARRSDDVRRVHADQDFVLNHQYDWRSLIRWPKIDLPNILVMMAKDRPSIWFLCHKVSLLESRVIVDCLPTRCGPPWALPRRDTSLTPQWRPFAVWHELHTPTAVVGCTVLYVK